MKEKKAMLRVKIPTRDKVKKAAKKDERTIETFVDRALNSASDSVLKK